MSDRIEQTTEFLIDDQMSAAVDSVLGERDAQRAKWGVQIHDPLYWLGIITEENGELAKAIIERRGVRDIRREAVQVAASALALIEFLDTGKA